MTLAFVIVRIPLQWKKIIPIAIGLATCVYLLRLLPIPFGTHTILLVILLFMILIRHSNGEVIQSLIASLLSYLIIVIFEFISISSLVYILGITSEAFFANTLLKIMLGEPQVLLTFLTAFLLNKKIILKKEG